MGWRLGVVALLLFWVGFGTHSLGHTHHHEHAHVHANANDPCHGDGRDHDHGHDHGDHTDCGVCWAIATGAVKALVVHSGTLVPGPGESSSPVCFGYPLPHSRQDTYQLRVRGPPACR